MNDSDFLSIFNFDLNQGDPISNCLCIELLRVKSCRQEFKKGPTTQGNWVVVVFLCGRPTVGFGRRSFFHGQRKRKISLILEMLKVFDVFRIVKQYMSCQ